MGFQRLPEELLDLISSDLSQWHPPSLQSLALVNKFCFAWCCPVIHSLRFHDVKVKLKKSDHLKRSLAKDVDRVLQILQNVKATQYVRRLVIDEHDEDTCTECKWGKESDLWQIPKLKDLPRPVLGEPFQPLYGNMNHPHHYSDYPDWDHTHGLIKDRAEDPNGLYNNWSWKPVVRLIQALPKLADLFYFCAAQFPPCLLDALHEYRPDCRLRLHSLTLLSLKRLEMDLHELRIMTSPSLYSIVLDRNVSGGSRSVSYRRAAKHALLRLIQGAPNLKEVYIYHTAEYATNDEQERHLALADSLDKVEVKVKNPSYLSSVVRFHVAASKYSDIHMLRDWSWYTNFTALQCLELRFAVNQEAIERHLLRCEFPSLRSLKWWMRMKNQPIGFYTTARHFLESLPPLEELVLEGWHSLIPVDSIVIYHGSRLRKLHLLYPHRHARRCLDEPEITQLALHCPRLEDLACKVQRSQGDSSEVARYRALGTIPRLRYLTLYLCASDPALDGGEETKIEPWSWHGRRDRDLAPTHPSFDDFDNEPSDPDTAQYYRSRNGHARRLMINTAVDEKLARAIFRVIASSKPVHAVALQGLDLRMDEPTDAVHHMLYTLSTSEWRVEPALRDSRKLEVVETRLTKDWATRGKQDMFAEPGPRSNFRRIWPRLGTFYKEGDGLEENNHPLSWVKMNVPVVLDWGWWNGWSSLPLATR
ncbi:uncharacterized protein N7459_003611 [Penicillium hispanicum]|uniref:uncharacterized protein n=1 Tax=Penicillium hispanicum TaxID=1080232 RepID=UPI0025401FB9|nr:uncharacterized protein N7459_003611 [Penicillium hispanicum]KAJ5587846.1 hypothetical protein N7459_003611 [Penicillium hispanicum]